MGRFVGLGALLLGSIGAISIQGAAGYSRVEYPVEPSQGCAPGKRVPDECPARLQCFKDSNYPLGGRCDCDVFWGHVLDKLPFDDSEWDDGFTTSDCRDLVFLRLVMAACHFVNWTLNAALFYTLVVVIRELYRNKALRWNATCYSLGFLTWAALATWGVATIFVANYIGGDRDEYWYMNRGMLYILFMPPHIIVDFEVGVTWIDLYDRTNKMSKSTSRALKVTRYALRVIALAVVVAYIFCVRSGNVVLLIMGAGMPSIIGMIFIAIAGKTILKVMCPDKKDVTNPNFKVAQAIRRAVKHGIVCKFMELITLFGCSASMRHPTLAGLYVVLTPAYFGTITIRFWGWLQYLIFGSRKHLKKFAGEASSAYFGFSTIGLNKTLTTASSALSTRSSAVSSRSSVAGDEKD